MRAPAVKLGTDKIQVETIQEETGETLRGKQNRITRMIGKKNGNHLRELPYLSCQANPYS